MDFNRAGCTILTSTSNNLFVAAYGKIPYYYCYCTVHTCVHNFIFDMAKSVVDLGGIRGVQMHPSLASSNVFLRT